MTTRKWLRLATSTAGAGTIIFIAAVSIHGCADTASDCEKIGTCCPEGEVCGAGGQGGGIPADCIPSDASVPVADDCGLFVSSSLGADTNPGTKAAPFATIGAALAARGTSGAIYVCAEAFTEAVGVTSGVSLFGGLDCNAGWSWSEAGRSTLTAMADEIPLTLTMGGGSSRIENFAITAADAMMPGGSSIAMLAANANAALTRCELVAGNGADGDDGMDQPAMDAGLNGTMGSSGSWVMSMVCTQAATDYMGGAGGSKMCGSTNVAGGNGGNSTNGTAGDPGQEGLPTSVGPSGDGGKGQDASSCGQGTQGADGMPNLGGAGADGAVSLTMTGYEPSVATAGTEGVHGQGGGGGGGARECQMTSNFAGPSGGGGGSGGCGGKGGGAGQSGGASIALATIDSTLTTDAVTLTAGAGGSGGGGGDGQTGGVASFMVANGGGAGACPGGLGGNGGAGSGGGGGAAGPSLALAFTGTAPTETTPATATAGTSGTPGMGGTGPGMAGTAGAMIAPCARYDATMASCLDG